MTDKAVIKQPSAVWSSTNNHGDKIEVHLITDGQTTGYEAQINYATDYSGWERPSEPFLRRDPGDPHFLESSLFKTVEEAKSALFSRGLISPEASLDHLPHTAPERK